MTAFENYRKTGETIGRLVVSYGELEFGIASLVGTILDDLDMAVKVLFRTRGESQRIQVADALARQKITPGKFRTRFEQTLGNVQHCLKIRNQYAHCNWIDRAERGLVFVNLEDVATKNAHINEAKFPERPIDETTIADQERFFVYVDDCLTTLRADWLKERGEPYMPFDYPAQVPRPPLYKGQGAADSRD